MIHMFLWSAGRCLVAETEARRDSPKQDLAVMAENMISLTSFKRRVSLDVETVSGSIDVAVIFKGDGFV